MNQGENRATASQPPKPVWIRYEPEPQNGRERFQLWILRHGFLVASGLVGLLVALALYFVPGPPGELLAEELSAFAEQSSSGTPSSSEASADASSPFGEQRLRANGSLWITSWPARATVLIDEEPVGQTPLRRHALSAGAHDLSLRKEGYHALDTVVVVRGSGSDVLRLVLRPRAAASSLSRAAAIDSEAANSSAAKSGAQGAEESPERAAAAEQARGSVLRVASEPAGATVWLDGRAVGETPLRVVGVPAGSHTLVLRRGGYASREREVVVGSAAVETVSERLVPQKGTVSVLVQPWGHVYIDGKLRKREADARYEVTLPAGLHRITVVHPKLGTWEETVRVAAQRTRSVVVNFNEATPKVAPPAAHRNDRASGDAAIINTAGQ